jgi:hypothetical protein
MAFSTEKKRMRIGYTRIDRDGNRCEDWVTFVPYVWNGSVKYRMAHYDGPASNANFGKILDLSWETLIEELRTCKTNKELHEKAYKLWSEHFGSASVDMTKESINKKRGAREALKRESIKKAKEASAASTPNVELGDEARRTEIQDVRKEATHVKRTIAEQKIEKRPFEGLSLREAWVEFTAGIDEYCKGIKDLVARMGEDESNF